MLPQVIVVMGVSGVGKTTVAEGIAEATGWQFAEGDQFHPQANIDKMSAGTPLNDEDRAPWLASLRDWLIDQLAQGRSSVITCSALKERYRDVLREAGPVRFVHLIADGELISDRLAVRKGHFMPASLLPSQFEALEPLTAQEKERGSVEVSVAGTPEQAIASALDLLGLK